MKTYFIRYCVIIIALFTISSCKKRILEIIAVTEIVKDMSLPDKVDVKFFSFPSNTVGYAAGTSNGSSTIYKTINRGSSWTIINVTSGVNTCLGIEFFTENRGMCLMGTTLYVTDDGGTTWTSGGTGHFLGISDQGIGVLGYADSRSGYYGYYNDIIITKDSGKTFHSIGNVYRDHEFTTGRVVGSKAFVFYKLMSTDSKVNGIDLIDSTAISFQFGRQYGEPIDIYLSNKLCVAVTTGGNIMESYDGTVGDYLGNRYDVHNQSYHSVDGYGDLVVCVGNKTIASNKDLNSEYRWNEVFDKNGESFKNIFYKIRFINQSTFYISGDKGLIYKMKI